MFFTQSITENYFFHSVLFTVYYSSRAEDVKKKGTNESDLVSKPSTPAPAARQERQGEALQDSEGGAEDGEDGRLAPQLRIGADGNIIIDEKR